MIYSIIIGGIVGWLASLLMKTNRQMGIIANILVGIVGSWLGLFMLGFIGIAAYGRVASFVVRILGASLLIALLKSAKIFK